MRGACMMLLVLLAALLTGVTPDSAEDAVFDRRSSTSEADVLAKQIAKQVGCEVCVLASKLIAQKMQDHTFKSEPELLEAIEVMCKGKPPNQEPIDRVLEFSGWAIEGDKDSGFKLVQQDKLSAETATLRKLEDKYSLMKGGEGSLGQYKRDSLQEACLLSVSAYQSELSEYLFTRLMRKQEVDDKVVAQKLCLELSESCVLKRPAKDANDQDDGQESEDAEEGQEDGPHDGDEDDDSEEHEGEEGEEEREDEEEPEDDENDDDPSFAEGLGRDEEEGEEEEDDDENEAQEDHGDDDDDDDDDHERASNENNEEEEEDERADPARRKRRDDL